MEEWKEYKLGDLYDVHNGLSKGGKFFGSGYPFLSFKTVFNNFFLPTTLPDLVQSNEKEQKGYDIKRGDVFVTRTSETPEELGMSSVALKDYPSATYNGFTKRLRPKNTTLVCPEFIGYYLRSRQFRGLFYGLASSMSTRASLANGDLLGMRVLLPSYDTQEKIANILKSLDDKIEVNRRINDNLEAQAQALFKSWFVDFEPFRDGEFVESELGMIPKGWRVGTIGDLAKISSGKRPPVKSASQSDEFTIPLVGASSIMGYTSDYLYDTKILVTGRVGTHGVVMRFNCQCWPSDNTLVMESNYYEYVYQCLKGIDYKNLNRGSTQPLITQTDLKNVGIVIPKGCFLDDYEKMISSIMKYAHNNDEESRRLATLRDTLLPRLMSGELKVNEIEK